MHSNPKRYYGKVCLNHPELLGERNLKSHRCIGCMRFQANKTARKRYAEDSDWREKQYIKSRDYAIKRKLADPEFKDRAIKSANVATLKRLKEDPEFYAKRLSNNRLRNSRMKQAQPCWVDAKNIASVYQEAKELSKLIGEWYHVDHIIPLRHPDVCGLHVPCNLQILPAIENQRKTNKVQIGQSGH